ncbi:SitI3 family protein [Aldersonia kunmingensis]|uniref:SitI3 family protein n=1 Tax=Aldersonia kunmingensis TaxID=408066 RepID=UPI000833CFA4|nr:SitI3 family protein [Aldersonia kunmingensis]
MAISYSFDIATLASAAEVARELLSIAQSSALFDAEVTAETLLDSGAKTVHGTWIRVTPATPLNWDRTGESLGFTPTVWIVFRFGRESDNSEQSADKLRIVSGLLDRISGDAVLYFGDGDENIWLVRRNDELTLNELDDIWRPERLALITQPYSRETQHWTE